MKKFKKVSLFIFIIVVVIVAIALIYMFYNKSNNKIKIDDDEQYIGTMYYSYMLGIDAGTEYLIYIYDSTDGSYKYKITKSDITIEGSINRKETDRGIINNKNDLINLNNQFINRKENNTDLYHSTYRHIDKADEKLSFEELADELFGND